MRETTIVNKPTHVNGVKVVQGIDEVIKELQEGNQVARFEYGNSMSPILVSGEYCILTPQTEANVGDAVFCIVNGYAMTHMVWLKSESAANGAMYLIGSSHGEIYGWTDTIYAVAKGTNVVEKEEELSEDMERILDNI